MKKTLLFFAIIFVSQLVVKSQTIATVTVTTPPFDCWVSLISSNEAAAGEYGWWSVWKDKKNSKNFAIANESNNYSVTLPADAGNYTLIVYRKGANYETDGSDGVVIEEIVCDVWYDEEWGSSLKYEFKKGDFVDWNCLSCPWLYVFDGNKFVKKTEIIKDVVGKENKQTNLYQLEASSVIDGKLKLKIQEEKDEISYLDKIALKVNGVYYPALLSDGNKHSLLLKEDNEYLTLVKGENIELEFLIPTNIKIESIELEATGYYEPSKEFISEVYQKCLLKNN